MKRISFLFVLVMTSISIFSQWNPVGNNESTGTLRVGLLNVGYEHAVTQFYMLIKGEDKAFGEIAFRYQTPEKKAIIRSEYDQGNGNLEFMTFPSNGNSQYRMSITGDGNIGVGIRTPTSKLHVNGDIKATKLSVAGEVNARSVNIAINAGADFVFKPDYKLRSLSDIESFVKEYHHLPEIPSEREMSENGVNVNEMQIKLLQKIEELTLYVIDQQKEIKELKQELKEIKK